MESYEAYEAYDVAASAAATGFMLIYSVFCLALAVVMLVALWKIYKKAGKPGWACIVPFYSQYCLFDIAMGNGWLFLLSFVPCVNIVMSIICYLKLAKAFGKGTGFGIGLILLCPIFIMILGFGKAEYVGPQ